MDGTSGSRISGSRSLQSVRSVEPRTYSFGCCKSLRIALLPTPAHRETAPRPTGCQRAVTSGASARRAAYQMRMNSCFSLPSGFFFCAIS